MQAELGRLGARLEILVVVASQLLELFLAALVTKKVNHGNKVTLPQYIGELLVVRLADPVERLLTNTCLEQTLGQLDKLRTEALIRALFVSNRNDTVSYRFRLLDGGCGRLRPLFGFPDPLELDLLVERALDFPCGWNRERVTKLELLRPLPCLFKHVSAWLQLCRLRAPGVDSF